MQAPTNWYDPLILPGIMTFAGVVVWFLAWSAERQGRRVAWKWVAYVLIAIGAFFGLQPFQAIQDYVYARQFLGERKKLYSHHLALLVPLGVMVALAVWQFAEKLFRKAKPVSN